MKKLILILAASLGSTTASYGFKVRKLYNPGKNINYENQVSKVKVLGENDNNCSMETGECPELVLSSKIYRNFNKWNFPDFHEISAEAVVYFKVDENRNIQVLGIIGNEIFSKLIAKKMNGINIKNGCYDPQTVYKIRLKYTEI